MERTTVRNKFKAEYEALKNAIDRCSRKNHPQYMDYGGRGLCVDPEFMCPVTGFVTFIAEVGAKPDPAFTLERICNDEGYVKGNLTWTDRASNMRNRRSPMAKARDLGWGVGHYIITRRDGSTQRRPSALVQLGDRTQTIKAWSKELGVATSTLVQRIQRGWTPEQALTSTIYSPATAPKPNA